MLSSFVRAWAGVREHYSIARSVDRLLDVYTQAVDRALRARGEEGATTGEGVSETRQAARGAVGQHRAVRGFEIHAAIRNMVTFACLNLAEDAYPSLSNNTNAIACEAAIVSDPGRMIRSCSETHVSWPR